MSTKAKKKQMEKNKKLAKKGKELGLSQKQFDGKLIGLVLIVINRLNFLQLFDLFIQGQGR